MAGWRGFNRGRGGVEMGEIQAKRAREERRVGRVGGEGVVGQSLKRVGVSEAGRVRGEVESLGFGLRPCSVLCFD